MYIFTDPYKGKERLNIAAHGNMLDESSRMLIGKKPGGTRYLEMEKCLSEHAIGKPVKGYINQVHTAPRLSIVGEYLRRQTIHGTFTATQDYFATNKTLKIFKENPCKVNETAYYKWNYQSKKFFPS